MKQTLLTLLLLLTGIGGYAQKTTPPPTTEIANTFVADTLATDTISPQALFTGTFYNEEIGLNIHLNLEEEDLIVPGMSFLGPVHGYMNGKIYGVWMLIKYELQGHKVILRFTNDIGSDSQNVELTAQKDGTFYYRTLNGNHVRRVEGRKLVKIAGEMPMKRKDLRL